MAIPPHSRRGPQGANRSRSDTAPGRTWPRTSSQGRPARRRATSGSPAGTSPRRGSRATSGGERRAGRLQVECRPRPGIPARASPMPQALAAARNQRREACDDKAATCEPTSVANELHRMIGAKSPVEVPFASGKNLGRESRVNDIARPRPRAHTQVPARAGT